jgi:hypothetical protein
VKLIAESGKAQYGMVTTTASYQSAQDRRLFFGIGQEKGVRSIEIEWPSGTKQMIDNPPIRKILRVMEK